MNIKGNFTAAPGLTGKIPLAMVVASVEVRDGEVSVVIGPNAHYYVIESDDGSLGMTFVHDNERALMC